MSAMRIAAALAASIVACSAHSQAYPSKAIRFIVPTAPGVAADVNARLLATRVAEQLGQPVVVENRPGADNMIGAEAAYRAAGDGYTIMYGLVQIFSINPWLITNLPYKAEEFVPVTLLSTTPWFLAVTPGVPAKSLAELLQVAKARGGKLTYASAGDGSYAHLLIERIKSLSGVDIAEIPYKSSSAELGDLLAGRVDIGFNTWSVYGAHFRSGKLKPLVVSLERRATAIAPDVPTIAEAGFPGLEFESWGSVVASPGTPAAAARRLEQEFLRALGIPEVGEDIARRGSVVKALNAEQFAAFLREDRARWGRLLKDSKLKPRTL